MRDEPTDFCDEQELSQVEAWPAPGVGLPTPIGRIQEVRAIADGVYWADTGAHGFLVLSYSLAQKQLTHAACKIGDRRGSWLFFEEDCAIAAPLFEHPEWDRAIGGPPYDADLSLRNNFPAYFDTPVQLSLL